MYRLTILFIAGAFLGLMCKSHPQGKKKLQIILFTVAAFAPGRKRYFPLHFHLLTNPRAMKLSSKVVTNETILCNFQMTHAAFLVYVRMAGNVSTMVKITAVNALKDLLEKTVSSVSYLATQGLSNHHHLCFVSYKYICWFFRMH